MIKHVQSKSFVLILLFFTFLNLSAQEFSIQFYFEDSQENLDSLVLGFDPAATHLIDAPFGEENIIDQSWNQDFEVRASDQWIRMYDNLPPTIYTKTQIVNRNDTGLGNNIIGVDIKNTN